MVGVVGSCGLGGQRARGRPATPASPQGQAAHPSSPSLQVLMVGGGTVPTPRGLDGGSGDEGVEAAAA